MNSIDIGKDDWNTFFNLISKYVSSQQVRVEVVSESSGDQVVVDWDAMDGLSYEPRGDILYVYAASFQHPIHNPIEVVVDSVGPMIRSVGVKCADGAIQLIQFREPLLLEAG